MGTQEMIVFLIFVALFAGFSVFLPGFLNANNIALLLQAVSVLGILSVAMGVIVIGGAIDLSIVALMAMSVAWTLQLINGGMPVPAALAIGLASVALVGLINGFLVAYVEIPPLFSTLATAGCIYGFGRFVLISQDTVYLPTNLGVIEELGKGRVFGVPMPVIVFAVIAAVVGLLLKYTKFGRFTYAAGDNRAAARITGVPVRPLIVAQFVLSAFIAFIAGLVQATAINSMNTRITDSLLVYEIILVVVLGGIGLSGGKGGIRNVVVGTLLIGTFLNGMTIMDIQFTTQNAIKGLILLTAIVIDQIVNPRDEQTSQQGDI
ncbi:MAG: ABC transporter permease [Phyllobacteriaceae bacterium]|nr:ABC transporter permease [Nitratireductor sp.]MCO5134287.1 ABC transporter permease [Phyllobacteriaceae bacterium]